MTMTPEDIQSQQFHVRFRGFDVEEVDSFLERVAEEFLMLKEEKRQLAEQVEALQKEIESYHSKEKAFQHAIMSAQQISDEMKVKSRQEAEQVAAAARQEAKQILEEANAEIAKLEGDVSRLQEMKRQVQDDLRRTLQNYLQGLEEGFSPAAAPTAQTEASAGRPEAGETRESETAGEEEDTPVVDLSDLYEKVDLPDEEIEASVSTQSDDLPEDEDVRELFKMDLEAEDEDEDEDEEDNPIPDLDEDMLFTLEDPEDEGPTLSLQDEEEEGADYESGRNQ